MIFPTDEEYSDIIKRYQVRDLMKPIDGFTKHDSTVITFITNREIQDWTVHLSHRLHDVYHSYIMAMFYFEKGIPDEELYCSPGKDGSSIEYFPNFIEDHYIWKHQFSYYADVFYYKMFSAWDTIGHIINVRYRMGMDPKK